MTCTVSSGTLNPTLLLLLTHLVCVLSMHALRRYVLCWLSPVADRVCRRVQGWGERRHDGYRWVPGVRSISDACHRLSALPTACRLFQHCHRRYLILISLVRIVAGRTIQWILPLTPTTTRISDRLESSIINLAVLVGIALIIIIKTTITSTKPTYQLISKLYTSLGFLTPISIHDISCFRIYANGCNGRNFKIVFQQGCNWPGILGN